MTETVLVTGGAGFIGSHVAAELLAQGHDDVVLDDLSGGFRENVPAGARLVEGSILDSVLIEALFREHRFAYVFHLAAYAAEGSWRAISGLKGWVRPLPKVPRLRSERLCWPRPCNGWCGQGAPSTNVARPLLQGH